MPVEHLLESWRREQTISANIAAWQEVPARPADLQPFPDDLHPGLRQALLASEITSLYSHQALAWQAVRNGENIVLVTGTASGKTLAYTLPVLDRLLRATDGRALFLFPTKALAHDQIASLNSLLAACGPGLSTPAIGIYDGDTPAGQRPAIRKKSRLLVSNPDMLHTGILPHHTNWVEFFRSLQIVVIDEMHSYRGVFGSHVANVLRRLKRVAHFYGARPQFILTSATIGNPAELAERLIEEKVTLIEQDGSARVPKSFLIYNPPVVDTRLGLRASALGESLRLADDLLVNHVQTLLFARSRRTVELLLTYLRQRAPVGDPERAIRGYRSGYMPALRREIEAGLRRGEVRLVAATNALELGVDIGQMGAAVLVGFPGTIASARQQAGRAGRGQEHSLAVLVATPDPLDQFLAAHPEYFFERSPEQALINPDHLLILLGHLRCAAFELPFQEGEDFGRLPAQTLAEYLAYLQEEGVLHRSGPRYFWMADQYPAQSISLRSASAENILLRAQEGENNPPYLVGQVDRESALWMVHPGAVYLHEGQSFLVNELDLEGRIAQLKPVSPDFYTEPIHQTDVAMIECLAQDAAAGCTKTYGELRVTDQVVGYRKLRWQTQEVLETNPLEMPVSELLTNGYWLALNEATVERLRQEGLWRNDPNQYGPTWKAQKDRARARDGYRCQMCGTPESSKAHDVHHIVPFRTFSSYEQANVLSNLVTLCSTCHGRAETAVRVRSGLAGLSYVLTHLAPLFLMCDVGDLGGYSHPQSPLAEGQPVAALYDRIPAGIGFSERLYEIHGELIASAVELVQRCACQDGCPSCVGPGGENGLGGKRETLAILENFKQRYNTALMPSLSDRLKSMGVKVGAGDLPSPPATRPVSLEHTLGGEFISTPLGETFMVEQRFPLDYQHGRLGLQVNAPLDVIAGWSREDRLRAMSPQAFAFLDTETTGLSGGTGTYAFLIGVGRFWEGEFQLAQFFMRDPSEEPAQLHALEAFLAPCQAVVTFNGKAFDVPILNARFISQGLRSPFFDIAHVDLLPLARRLWRDRLPSRTLGNLEYQILGALRSEEDVPGWMVPSLYFDFLRSGDPHPLRGVFYHNSVDVISLAALFNYVAIRLADPLGGEAPDPVDEIAMAKLFEDLGDLTAATQLYLDGLTRELPLPNQVEAVERLARLYKRQGQITAARELWEQAARHGSLDSCLALAKDCEHRLSDYPGAMEWTLLGMENLRSSTRPAYQTAQMQAELEHRLQRLERKLAG